MRLNLVLGEASPQTLVLKPICGFNSNRPEINKLSFNTVHCIKNPHN